MAEICQAANRGRQIDSYWHNIDNRPATTADGVPLEAGMRVYLKEGYVVEVEDYYGPKKCLETEGHTGCDALTFVGKKFCRRTDQVWASRRAMLESRIESMTRYRDENAARAYNAGIQLEELRKQLEQTKEGE